MGRSSGIARPSVDRNNTLPPAPCTTKNGSLEPLRLIGTMQLDIVGRGCDAGALGVSAAAVVAAVEALSDPVDSAGAAACSAGSPDTAVAVSAAGALAATSVASMS